ncbi:MAG: hypothetical protein K2K15_04130 [Anaeroplasmataceae bacterium]|nr:hypothetical protein [Anaeroplasmataceae bacterium]
MEILKEYMDTYFKESSRVLGNCYIVKTALRTYHYEFILKGKHAIISYDALDFIEEVTEIHHKEHKYIEDYSTENHSFYKSYEKTFTFKLPIEILQVSRFCLSKERLDNLRTHVELEEIYLPVQIIDDEYVLLNQHHLLYLLKENDFKMVEVYLDEDTPIIRDFLYLLKEQNIRHIDELPILSEQSFVELYDELKKICQF